MKTAYNALFAVMLGITVMYGVATLAATPSVRFGNYLERLRWERGEASYQLLKNDLPFEVGTIHKEAFELASHNNLILLGSSNTRDAIWPDVLTLPRGWNYHNMGISGANVTSLRLLLNFLNEVSGHPPNKSDVVVIHSWYVTFWNRALNSDYLKSNIEMFGQYKVDSSLRVDYRPSGWERELAITNYRIHGAIAWPFGWPHVEPALDARTLAHIRTKGPFFPDAGSPRPGTPEAAKAYRDFYGALMENTTIPGPTTNEFIELVRLLNKQSNVVVINLYSATWHTPTRWQQDYERWLNSELRPMLSREHIPFIDFQHAIPDYEFIDGAHLKKEGRIHYTRLFAEAIAPILNNVDVRLSTQR